MVVSICQFRNDIVRLFTDVAVVACQKLDNPMMERQEVWLSGGSVCVKFEQSNSTYARWTRCQGGCKFISKVASVPRFCLSRLGQRK